MATEALTQYKLMILYLLHSVKYPLSNSRLSGFLLENEYTTYFTLQQCINDLVEASLISAEHSQSTTRYEITEEGKQTLSFFSQDIPELVREDMDLFLSKNKSRQIGGSIFRLFGDRYEGIPCAAGNSGKSHPAL